ncbi:hypothetical protein H4S01_001222 [Coemansia sp. RSA 2610]|nr:hypothetical protein H4S01_001222 [Coemansia sp. RSA 2610]
MSPRKLRDARGAAEANSQTSSTADEWAPRDDELGTTLSQALRGSTRAASHNHRATLSAKSKASTSPRRVQTSCYVDIVQSPDKKHQRGLADKHKLGQDSGSPTKQQQAIAAMFTDSEHEVEIKSWADSASELPPEMGEQQPTGGMDFMDEESAANYRRLLALNQQTKQRETRQRARQQRRPSGGPATRRQRQTNPPIAIDEPPSGPSLAPKTITLDSADDLPDNPIDAAESPKRCAKRRRSEPMHQPRRRPQISDTETDGESSDVLNRDAIIGQRLRARPSVSAARSRIEQARRDAGRRMYASDSDSAADLADEIVDMPETESESEKRQGAVLVIRDSSDEDDDDFISEPDDLPKRQPPPPVARPMPRAAEDTLNSFLSAFEPGRQRQMKRRHQARISGASRRNPEMSEPRKEVRGYSSGLDDDLADFIVDDDVDEEVIAHAVGSPSVARNQNAGSDSGQSLGPSFGLEKPHGALSLLPEEFSQMDLQTSFKTYVQYLVHWICNDREKLAISSDIARYFYLGYITVARVIDSVELSVVASSVWLDDFRTDLYRYPEYRIAYIQATPGCQACHFRDNRTATFRVTFSGTPYKRITLMPPHGDALETSDDQDETDTDSVASVGSQPERPPKYNVGKTCKLRSEICHQLHHYFYHLSYEVDIALQALQAEDPSNAAFNSDAAGADDLVTALEAQGTMDRLYDKFKDLVANAMSEFTS